jgi:hypothetical protein
VSIDPFFLEAQNMPYQIVGGPDTDELAKALFGGNHMVRETALFTVERLGRLSVSIDSVTRKQKFSSCLELSGQICRSLGGPLENVQVNYDTLDRSGQMHIESEEVINLPT